MQEIQLRPFYAWAVLRVDSTVIISSNWETTVKWIAIAAMSVLAISPARAQKPSPGVALAEAEARWRAHGPKAYEYEVYLTCFCPISGGRFRVVSGVSEPVKDLNGFNTVEQL